MSTIDLAAPPAVPDEIARQIVLPEGHVDEQKLYDAYSWMRHNMPIGLSQVEGYDPLWLLSKYDDIMAVSLKPTIFSNAGGGDNKGSHNPILRNRAGDEFTRTLTGGHLRLLESLPFLDPPEHGDVKDMAAAWFRPGSLKEREPLIREIAKSVIDERLVTGNNEIDLVHDFSIHYPLRVINKLLGVPEEDEPLMWSLSQDLFGTDDPDRRKDDAPTTPEAAAAQWATTIGSFYEYFDSMIDARRENPRDDLASLLSNARRSNGELFERQFVHSWFVAVATAGHETTSSTLAGGLEALSHAPDELRKVQDDPSLVTGLVAESLRYVSPAKHMMRMAVTDTEVGDQFVHAGDRLMPLYQSANRDEDVFTNPDEFHVDRGTTKQAAFGFGPHMCIGLNLAKLELRVMFEELIPRIASIDCDAREVGPSNHVLNLKRLPCRLTLR